MFLLGSWLQTPRWYKYRKSVEPYLCLFSITRFWNTYPIRISKQRPRRIWKATKQSSPRMDALRRDNPYPKGRLLPSCFGRLWNLPDSYRPKQALINAFYNMSANFWFATAKLLHFFELRKNNTKKIATYVQNTNGEGLIGWFVMLFCQCTFAISSFLLSITGNYSAGFATGYMLRERWLLRGVGTSVPSICLRRCSFVRRLVLL